MSFGRRWAEASLHVLASMARAPGPVVLDSDWRRDVLAYYAAFEAGEVSVDVESGSERIPTAELVARAAEYGEGFFRAVEAMSAGVGGARAAAELIRPWIIHHLVPFFVRYRGNDTVEAVFGSFHLLLLAASLVDETLRDAMPTDAVSEPLYALWQHVVTGFELEEPENLVGAVETAALLLLRAVLGWIGLLDSSNPWLRPRLRLGFDGTPTLDPALGAAQLAARVTSTMFFPAPARVLSGGDYGAFEPMAPLFDDRTVVVSTVPITRSPSRYLPAPAENAHRPGAYVQLRGEVPLPIEINSDASSLRVAVGGTGGLLVPIPGLGAGRALDAAVIGGPSASLEFRHTRQPAPDDGEDPFSISVERQFARVRLEGTAASAGTSVSAALAASYDLEGVELRLRDVPLLNADLRVHFDLGLEAYLRSDGAAAIRLRGGIGGEVVLAINRTLGSRDGWGIEIRTVRVGFDAGAGDDAAGGRAGLAARATVDFSIHVAGAAHVHVDGLGGGFRARTSDQLEGNLAGVVDAGLSLIVPHGAGIELKVCSIEGGGFVSYEPARHRFGGVLAITIRKKVALTLLALVETPPGLAASWLFLGAAEFPAYGPVTGAGVLFATGRTTDVDAFLASVRTGDLDALLFPGAPIENFERIRGGLERLFPAAAGSHVGGLMVRLAWAAGRFTLTVGVLFEWGRTTRLYVVAQARFVAPTEDLPAVRIQCDGVGVWDFSRNEGQIRLALRNSTLFGGVLTGEALIFAGDPDPGDGRSERVALMSVGGFHPAYVVPGPAIRVPERIALSLAKGDQLRLDVKAYVALTPGALHFGLDAALQARFAGFGIRTRLVVDGFLAFSKHEQSSLAISAAVELQLGSRTLFGASLEGEIVAPNPFELRGRVCVSFLLWSWCSPRWTVSLVSGDDRTEAVPDVAGRLTAAVSEVSNWSGGGAPGLALRSGPRDGVWASPSQPLQFTQAVLPLGHPIARFEGRRLSQPVTLTIDVERGASTWLEEPTDGEFAPALFFELSRAQRLSAKGFESLPAGFALARPLEAPPGVTVALDYEDVVVDSANPTTAAVGTVPFDPTLERASASLDPRGGAGSVRSPKRPLRVRGDRYAVIDGAGGVVARDVSYVRALGRSLAQPAQVVVPLDEVA